MKYGDIVVYKNQIGKVVKSENDFEENNEEDENYMPFG